MKKIVYLIAISIVVFGGCSSNKKNQNDTLKNSSAKTPVTINTGEALNKIELKNIDEYFAVKTVADPLVVVLNGSNFKDYFQPAKTMNNHPTTIDFGIERVGAIILPESWYDVTISLDESYLSGKTLNVSYSIIDGPEKRAFSVKPSKIFSFKSDLDIDSVAFKNGSNVKTIAIE